MYGSVKVNFRSYLTSLLDRRIVLLGSGRFTSTEWGPESGTEQDDEKTSPSPGKN
jgi:hypothetical protein